MSNVNRELFDWQERVSNVAKELCDRQERMSNVAKELWLTGTYV